MGSPASTGTRWAQVPYARYEDEDGMFQILVYRSASAVGETDWAPLFELLPLKEPTALDLTRAVYLERVEL